MRHCNDVYLKNVPPEADYAIELYWFSDSDGSDKGLVASADDWLKMARARRWPLNLRSQRARLVRIHMHASLVHIPNFLTG